MLIKHTKKSQLKESQLTSESVYKDRRNIIKGLGLTALSAPFTSFANASVFDLFSSDDNSAGGESTYHIAKMHPEAIILGMDKSADRLSKHPLDKEDLGNYQLLQVNLNDFWRLAVEANWTLSHHYLLYPNPWPKAKHLQRRWHGSAVFPSIIKLGGQLDLRSNWFTYVEEFQRALALANIESDTELYTAEKAITPFERKYWASGQASLRLTSNL